MRFESLHMDGFGVFHDFGIAAFAPGINVVTGPNEAGKSTLLAFIRGVLFGFPDGRATANRYEPLAGGRHGGRLVLVDPSGLTYSLERHAEAKLRVPTLSRADGSIVDHGALEVMLGHADLDLYRRMFAFDLQELDNLKSITDASMRGKIFGAGLGAPNLSDAITQLTGEASALYRPRGSAPRINRLLAELEDVDSQLRALAPGPQEYERVRRELDEAEQLREQLRESVGKARAAHLRLEVLRKAWTPWMQWQKAEDELRELPTVADFPTDAVARLDALERNRRDGHTKRTELSSSVDRLLDDLSRVMVDDQLLADRQSIEVLREGLRHAESAQRDLPDVHGQLRSEDLSLAELLGRIGPAWDTARLAALDISVQQRAVVRALLHRLGLASTAVRDAERDVKTCREHEDGAAALVEERSEQFKAHSVGASEDPAWYEARKTAVRALRGGVVELQRLDFDIARQQDRVISEERDARPAFPTLGVVGARVLPLVLFAAAAVLLSVGIIIGQALMGALGAAVVASAAVVLITARSLGGPADTAQEARRHLAELTTQRNSLVQELAAPAATLGGLSLDARAIESCDAEVNSDFLSYQQWAEASRGLVSANQQRERAAQSFEKARLLLATAQSGVDAVRAEWVAWLETCGLAPDLSPETALDVLRIAETARSQVKVVDELRTGADRMALRLDNYAAEVNEVHRRLGIPDIAPDATVVAVQALQFDLKRTVQADLKRAGLVEKLDTARTDLETQSDFLDRLKAELETLLASVQAPDSDTYRVQAAHSGERAALNRQIQEVRFALETLVGRDAALERLTDELEGDSPELLELRLGDATDELAGLETEFADAAKDSALLGQRLAELEAEDKTHALRQRRAALAAELEVLAGNWAVCAVAQHLLETARAVYERERRPAVVKAADTYLARLTGGRYPALIAPLDDPAIGVRTLSGGRLEIEHLSRGTAEQLYLALRFGLVREFGQREVALPVVLDDILVNFDPERSTAACEAIAELAQHHQVLYLTCHPPTVDRLVAAEPNTRVITLAGEAPDR